MKFILILLVSVGSLMASQEPDHSYPPIIVNESDLQTLPDLLPTTYFTAKESEISCRGRYGRRGPLYRGTEKTALQEMDGTVIATVCTRFYKVLAMEGSAILKDRGQGEMAINYSGKVRKKPRFHRLGKCSFGEGVQRDLCLLPYHTLAADNKVHSYP
jgi:hypothetical protein